MMTVDRIDDVVIKHDVPYPAAEAAKLRAYRSAAGTDLEVPRVLALDVANRTLTMSRLPAFEPLLTTYLRAGAGASAAFRLAGSALARLHAVSTVDEDWVQKLMNSAGRPEGPFLLHGDYGFSNVGLVRRGAGLRLVVFDPSPDRVNVTSPNQCGWPIDDMGLMASCLLGRVPLRRLPALRRIPRDALLRAFHSGYREVADPSCSVTDMTMRGLEVLAAYLQRCRRLPRPIALAAARRAAAGLTSLAQEER